MARSSSTALQELQEHGKGVGDRVGGKKCLKISLRIANVVRSTCTMKRQRRNYSPVISGYLLKDLVFHLPLPPPPAKKSIVKKNTKRARVKRWRKEEENKVNTIVCKENGLNVWGWIAKAVHPQHDALFVLLSPIVSRISLSMRRRTGKGNICLLAIFICRACFRLFPRLISPISLCLRASAFSGTP